MPAPICPGARFTVFRCHSAQFSSGRSIDQVVSSERWSSGRQADNTGLPEPSDEEVCYHESKSENRNGADEPVVPGEQVKANGHNRQCDDAHCGEPIQNELPCVSHGGKSWLSSTLFTKPCRQSNSCMKGQSKAPASVRQDGEANPASGRHDQGLARLFTRAPSNMFTARLRTYPVPRGHKFIPICGLNLARGARVRILNGRDAPSPLRDASCGRRDARVSRATPTDGFPSSRKPAA